VESRVDMDGGAGSFATRNSFVGLKVESWGQLVLGRHDTPYKIATRRLDIFGDSMGDNRSLMGGGIKGKNSALQFDGRPNDVVMYTTVHERLHRSGVLRRRCGGCHCLR